MLPTEVLRLLIGPENVQDVPSVPKENRQIEKVSFMSSTVHPIIISSHVVDRTMLDLTIFRPSPDVQASTMEGETVLLNLSTGRYYTLNRLGSIIWEHCAGQSTMTDIHRALCNRFEVAPERALGDLVNLVNELIQEGLLQQERR